jgi:hypothetical protein
VAQIERWLSFKSRLNPPRTPPREHGRVTATDSRGSCPVPLRARTEKASGFFLNHHSTPLHRDASTRTGNHRTVKWHVRRERHLFPSKAQISSPCENKWRSAQRASQTGTVARCALPRPSLADAPPAILRDHPREPLSVAAGPHVTPLLLLLFTAPMCPL